MREWRWRTVSASGLGVTRRTSGPGLLLMKVRVTSTSVFQGKLRVRGR
jgi:hypothetical protein